GAGGWPRRRARPRDLVATGSRQARPRPRRRRARSGSRPRSSPACPRRIPGHRCSRARPVAQPRSSSSGTGGWRSRRGRAGRPQPERPDPAGRSAGSGGAAPPRGVPNRPPGRLRRPDPGGCRDAPADLAGLRPRHRGALRPVPHDAGSGGDRGGAGAGSGRGEGGRSGRCFGV
ncbi:MAG: Transcriptional regulator, MarR family, partial [uncultured Thermomicrobiales bacterium]